MFGKERKEAVAPYEGRLLTVDTVVVPEGKTIRYGDMVLIRNYETKFTTLNEFEPITTFRLAVGKLSPEPDAIIGLRIDHSQQVGSYTVVYGTPVWFE